MSTVLIVYASKFGQTAKIATRIAARLGVSGIAAETCEVSEMRGRALDADLVAVGASVHGGKHLGAIAKFVQRRRAELDRVPTAFFSVSMAARREPATAQEYIAGFMKQTGWRPTLFAAFAGGLAYRRYGWLMRWMMKRISRSHGDETDTSRDFEYTDWTAVDRFAARMAVKLRPPRRWSSTTDEQEQVSPS